MIIQVLRQEDSIDTTLKLNFDSELCSWPIRRRAENQYFPISGQYIWAGTRMPRKRDFSCSPLKSTPNRVLMRCTASFPFFLHVGDRVPHLPADCDSQIIIRKKVRCQRADARTYLHWLQFIFHASE